MLTRTAASCGGIVRRIAVTPASVHDSQGLEPVLPGRPGRVWADSANDSQAIHDRVRERRGSPRIARRLHKRMSPAKAAAWRGWNATVARVCCRVEKIFGTAKRSYGLGRARCLGLARVSLQVHLTFVAYNLTRACNLQRTRVASKAGRRLRTSGQPRQGTRRRRKASPNLVAGSPITGLSGLPAQVSRNY